MIWLLAAAFGSEGQAIDLSHARVASMNQAIGVLRQQAVLDEVRGASTEAIADVLPQIGVFASATTVSGPNPFGRFTSRQAQAGVAASWQLVAPGGWAAAASIRSTVRGQTALLEWSEALARRDATIRFAEAVSAVEVVEALRTAENDAAEAARGIQSLADAGLRPLADAVQADAVAASLTARRVAAEGEVGATCAALQAQMGAPIDGHCSLVEPSSWPEPGTTEAVHPALRAAREAVNAARRLRTAAIGERAPTIVGTAEAAQGVGSAVVGDDTDDARDLSGLSLSAGLRADLPVISSGAGIAGVRQATATREAVEVALDEQERLLASGRVAADARYAAALAGVEASRRSRAAAREALALVEARYEQGLADLPTFIEARRSRDDALVALALARAEVGRALAELEANLGIGRP